MPTIPSFVAGPGASGIPRGFAHLASDASAGAIAGAPTEVKVAPPTVQRIQGTGGLRQLPKVEPVNELVSRARNRVRTLYVPFSLCSVGPLCTTIPRIEQPFHNFFAMAFMHSLHLCPRRFE